MDIQEIINRNYAATCSRGLITPRTTKQEFTVKMVEEIDELNNEICFEHSDNEPVELADIILVCLAYAKHFNIDILTELEKKTLYNETRTPVCDHFFVYDWKNKIYTCNKCNLPYDESKI